MTDITKIKHSCPRCGKSSDLTIWKSVNTQLNPELKPKVMDGSLFVFHCIYCNYNQEVAYAMLYHAQQDHCMIWWIPKDEDGKQVYSPRELETMAKKLPGYKLRLVSSLNRLREKISIFDAGLDDRAIELLKRSVWATQLAFEDVEPSALYFVSSNFQAGSRAVEFAYFTSKGESKAIMASGMVGYDLATKLLRDFKVPAIEPTKWRIVDETYWALAEQGQG